MDVALALIVVSLAAGYLAARLGIFPKDAADVLHRFVIYVCLPAVVLRLVPQLSFRRELALLVIVPWACIVAGSLLVRSASHAFGFSRQVTGSLILCVTIGNTSFLGFPMIGALLGPDAVRYAVVYDQLGSFFALATFGLVVVARYSGQDDPGFGQIVLRLFKFPPFPALLLALLPVPHPAAMDAVLARLGDTLVPIALFAVGLRLELRVPTALGAFAVGLGAKMVVLPLFAYAVVRAVSSGDLAGKVAVLEAAMPPSITAGALAGMAGLAPELAAALVGYGVIASFGTLPAAAALLR